MDMERYFEGMAKGLTGKALADYIGVRIPTPAPVDEPPAGPIAPESPIRGVYVNEPIENIVARQRGIQVPYVTQPEAAVQEPVVSQVDESKDSIKEAMQLIGLRGFQQDIDIGIPQHVAMAKWFPMMAAGRTGAASTYRAMQPGGQELLQQEVAPGKMAVFRPGGSTVQIVSTAPPPGDEMIKLKRRTDILRALQDIEPTSPGYASLTNELARLDQQIQPAAPTPARPTITAPPTAAQSAVPVRKPFTYFGPNIPEERLIESRQSQTAASPTPVAPIATSGNRRLRYNPATRKFEPV